MIGLLIALSHVVAAEALDFDMTTQERKKTGVYKLTNKEKAALQNWIDVHYEKRSEPLAQEERERSQLVENLHNGRYIRLANGSLWKIRPSDTNIAQGWITPVDILVTQSGDSDYPYKLTNSVTGSSLLARKIKNLPSSATK